MQKETLVVLIGFVLVLLPQLGIPDDLKRAFTIGAGVLLMVTGYMLLRDRFHIHADLGNGERGTDTFVETTGSLFDERMQKKK